MSKRSLAVLLAFVAVAAAVATVVLTRATRPSLTTAELTAYEDAIHPPLADGGRVVEQQMKPKLADLHDGKVPPSEADTWIAALTDVRGKVAAVTPPEALKESHRLFLGALDKYVDAAETFKLAATDAARRDALVETAIATARTADRTYDSASLILQNWRRELGLDPTADFPDPTPT